MLNKPHVKYRNIIFDLGNVLIDWNPIDYIQKFFDENDHLELINLLTDPIAQQWDLDHDRGIATPEDLVNAISIACDKEKVLQFFEYLPNFLLPIPQGIDWFNRAYTRGYKIYILSNYPKSLYEAISNKYEFFKKVHGGIISYQVKKLKPEPEIYLELLTKYNLISEECLFIDDREDNIQGALAVGIDGIVCIDHLIVDKELINRFIF